MWLDYYLLATVAQLVAQLAVECAQKYGLFQTAYFGWRDLDEASPNVCAPSFQIRIQI